LPTYKSDCFELACIVHLLAGGKFPFVHLGNISALAKARGVPKSQLPTFDLPPVVALRRFSLHQITHDQLGGCTRPTAFLPIADYNLSLPWDCVVYVPPSTANVPHEITFIKASMAPVHERPPKWDDPDYNTYTKVGRIYKSLLPTIEQNSALSLCSEPYFHNADLFNPLCWLCPSEEKGKSRTEPLVERLVSAISGIQCNVKVSNQDGEIEVTPEQSQDLLAVRFVFMTAQPLNTITKEECGVVDGSLPKLANLLVISAHNVDGFAYLKHLAI